MGVLEAILNILWVTLTMFGQNFGHFGEFLDVMGIVLPFSGNFRTFLVETLETYRAELSREVTDLKELLHIFRGNFGHLKEGGTYFRHF